MSSAFQELGGLQLEEFLSLTQPSPAKDRITASKDTIRRKLFESWGWRANLHLDELGLARKDVLLE